MENIQPPKFAMVGKTEMICQPGNKRYYRHAGEWGIGCKLKNGEFVSTSIKGMPWLTELPIIEITEEKWKDANRGYL